MAMAGGDGLSGMLGWISIACWFVVYSPQILENYRCKSGEGLSVSFIVIWLIGDLFNLSGAILAGLLSTVIILAAYYTFCDLFLLFQIYFYRWSTKAKSRLPNVIDTSHQPLLTRSRQPAANKELFIRYLAAMCFVVSTGVVAWWLSKGGEELDVSKPLEWRVQLMGWTSAILYLGARIPQILKNVETRCQGLSPGLFLFAMMGNVTFALSICAASLERNYLITNGSWLAGSVLVAFLDIAVLCQFAYYRSVGVHVEHIAGRSRGPLSQN